MKKLRFRPITYKIEPKKSAPALWKSRKNYENSNTCNTVDFVEAFAAGAGLAVAVVGLSGARLPTDHFPRDFPALFRANWAGARCRLGRGWFLWVFFVFLYRWWCDGRVWGELSGGRRVGVRVVSFMDSPLNGAFGGIAWKPLQSIIQRSLFPCSR